MHLGHPDERVNQGLIMVDGGLIVVIIELSLVEKVGGSK
jgi:hypothetical protein